MEYQYNEYFARFLGPILFVAGVMSILLSGFQVAVAVQSVDPSPNGQALLAVAFWSSISLMLLFFAVLTALLVTLLFKIAREWRCAIRDRVQLLEEARR